MGRKPIDSRLRSIMRQFHKGRAAIPHRKIGVRKWRLPRCADVPDGGAWLGQAAARGEGVRGFRGLNGWPGGRARGGVRRPWWFDAYEVHGRSVPRIDGGELRRGGAAIPRSTRRCRHRRYPRDRGMTGESQRGWNRWGAVPTRWRNGRHEKARVARAFLRDARADQAKGERRSLRLCSWTVSTSTETCSGGVNCEMPCPRLKTWPRPVLAAP